MRDEPLGAEDYESVRAAVEALGKAATLNGQVEAWASLVEVVETGYESSVYEYTNDLYVRSWLEQVRGLVTEPVRRSLDTRLAPLDARFLAATRPSERVGGAGWWCREPARLVGDLVADLGRG